MQIKASKAALIADVAENCILSQCCLRISYSLFDAIVIGLHAIIYGIRIIYGVGLKLSLFN